jgi:TPR repeat protein
MKLPILGHRKSDLHGAIVAAAFAASLSCAERAWTHACLLGDKSTFALQRDSEQCQTLIDEGASSSKPASLAACLESRGWRLMTEQERSAPDVQCTGDTKSLELCDQGNADSCFGICTEREKANDHQAAIKFCGKSCDLKNGPACERLGDIQRANKALADAAVSYDAACALGMPSSCYRLGDWHWKGVNVDLNPETALTYLRKACQGGGLGNLCQSGIELVRHRSVDLAMQFARSGCEKGNQVCCAEFAADNDSSKLSEACEQGEGAACAALADRIEKDPEGENLKPVDLRNLACKLKHGPSCISLATAEANGRSGQRKAIDLLKRACGVGDAIDCVQVGRYFEKGAVIPKDLGFAASSYLKACRAQVAVACWVLSELSRRERIPGFDRAKADEFAQQACRLGVAEACHVSNGK